MLPKMKSEKIRILSIRFMSDFKSPIGLVNRVIIEGVLAGSPASL